MRTREQEQEKKEPESPRLSRLSTHLFVFLLRLTEDLGGPRSRARLFFLKVVILTAGLAVYLVFFFQTYKHRAIKIFKSIALGLEQNT